MAAVLSPNVFWAQSEEFISLRVDLKNVSDRQIEVTEDSVFFVATGIGALGEKQYQFCLNFYLPVLPKESSYRVVDRQVEFNIKKSGAEWWPRLTEGQKKPHWLKLDFDKWKDEDDDEDEERLHKEEFGAVGPFDEVKGKAAIAEQENTDSYNFKPSYLFFYNFFQSVGYLMIFIILVVKFLANGESALKTGYSSVGSRLLYTQTAAYLELFHPLLGLVKGGVLAPFLQINGRNLVLMMIIASEPRVQTQPIVFYLFLVWSLSESIRYPYYFLSLMKRETAFLTWLRYSAWIILYPAGFMCEGMVVLLAIPYFEETGKWSFTFPEPLNFKFSFPGFLRIYLLVIFIPACYLLTRHMLKQRKSKIGPFSPKKKKTTKKTKSK